MTLTDAQGNLNKEVKIVNNVTYVTQYGYNKNNALISITYPSGRIVTYTLDTTGRVSQVSTPIGGVSKVLASSISYLPFGGVTGLIYGNGLSLNQDYDYQYRTSSIIAGSLLYLTYWYDANGNITSILDGTNPSGSGSLEIPGTYTYEQGSSILMSITGPSLVTYDSDLSGNRILENNRVYGYDQLNRLITVTDNGTQIAAYTYNASNQRVSKTTSTGTKIFHYDLSGHLIAETNNLGQTLVEYVYLGDQPLAMIRPTGAVYYYHNDHLGTPRILTNSSGAIVWKACYTPFGVATITTPTVENNIRFPGQYFDIETGLHYNWNRYYDPKIGRYITADPIGLEGRVNLFGYVEGNPVSWIDPAGLFSDGGPGAKYPGHSNFTGSKDCFDYTTEDYGITDPWLIIYTEHHFQDLPAANRDVAEAISSCDVKKFERAMHRGQDYFAHWRKGYRWDPGNKALPCGGWGHKCDPSADNDRKAWQDAERWTITKVNFWNKKCFCKCNSTK